MARFFIDRPIFAWVVSLAIILAGILSLRLLPVEQYPDIAPPTVEITSVYPGASARTVEEAVTTLIERELNGAPGLMYMSSSSAANLSTITVTFKQGSNIDLAAVEVQNRLKIVESRLPETVRRQGIKVEKVSNSFAMIVTLSSKDPSWGESQLGELATSVVLEPLRRVPGVGKVQQFGTESAMRIWPDPAKLAAMNLTAADVSSTLRTYSSRVTVGALGQLGVPDSAPLSANMSSESPYKTAADFGNIPLRVNSDGSAVRIKDVARVEVGAAEYGTSGRLNGKPVSGLAVKLAPGSNAIDTANHIRTMLDKLSSRLPKAVQYEVPFETSQFVKLSIESVIHTLIEAMILVFLVMFLFMQNFRATLIPALVVPVALLGTLAVLLSLGYSINVLSMFAMVLAIGILVDDAIVVVENVERLMAEEGLSPRAATIKAMSQISGAIIGITVVLIAVFLPMAFFGGVVGNIYRQFAVTLAVSIFFSAFLALSLTPALTATLLKPIAHGAHTNRFFAWFNETFKRATLSYGTQVDRIIRRPLRSIIAFGVVVLVAAILFIRLPSAFLPEEDQGYFLTLVNKPQGTPLAETMKSLDEIQHYLREKEPVSYTYAIGGWSFLGMGTNTGIVFSILKHWDERKSADQSVYAIIQRVNAAFQGRDFSAFVLNPPPLPGLGNSTGFDIRLEDQDGMGQDSFVKARNTLIGLANQDPQIAMAYFSGVPDSTEVELSIDREKAEAMGVPIAEINTALAVLFGSDYVGDFMLKNQVRKIMVQAEGANRLELSDVGKVYVRSNSGAMVPLAGFIDLKWTIGPPQLTRFNGYPSMTINGAAPPSGSSGDAMKAMEALMAKLPSGTGFEWAGQSAEERESGSQAPLLYALSLLIVFLALAALYESWSIPLAVILVVPLGVLGAVLGVTIRGLPNDVYFRVGLIATIGLSAKNAILIVEVAKDLYAEGMDIYEATLEACRLRLRPIVMTSLAFGIGVLPLMLAKGAGSSAQNAIGTGVFGGIVFATVLAIFLVPMFFTVVGRYFNVGRTTVKDEENQDESALALKEAPL